jgi:uncharacterized ferritin-like protein (DUF455 family)
LEAAAGGIRHCGQSASATGAAGTPAPAAAARHAQAQGRRQSGEARRPAARAGAHRAQRDLPAHDGLWQAAAETAHDLLARLAVVPLVLEARGLDVTPATIADFRRAGDEPSAAILERIYRDEIGHVAAGARWFHHFAEQAGLDPKQAWRERVRRHFKGTLKPPFNDQARSDAGFDPDFYRALAN